MVTVHYGGKTGTPLNLEVSDDYLVVRTNSRQCLTRSVPAQQSPISQEACDILNQYDVVTRFDEAGVEVLKTKQHEGSQQLRDRARTVLNAEPELQFAGRVLVDTQSHQPVVYTENIFIKFDDHLTVGDCEALLGQHRLIIKRKLDYARNSYFVEPSEHPGMQIFEIANELLALKEVELCHPELVRENRQRQIFEHQWHLKETIVNNQTINAHINVEEAWELTQGEDVIIAIVDDGVDMEHEEFRGSRKIVAPRDVTRQSNDPRPLNWNDHGTACAGVACANGNFSASGVAPNARLMPIRLASGLGSMAEADAFMWAAQNGADIISCSWGPQDGVWYDANDPRHDLYVPLPDSTRLAIDYAVREGRNGKGCVVLFAAGNGNESIENDGYASYDNVIAIAACNDFNERSAYSDYGASVWCTFPSSHGYPSKTPGIWTTDRSGGLGYNRGDSRQGDADGHYTNNFGGTSSACPGAAGIAALILSYNPDLTWTDVREILKQSCDRIDEAGGSYNAEGHSPYYGYGRLNAKKAVELAKPSQANEQLRYSARQDVPIKDLNKAQLSIAIADSRAMQNLAVEVDIEHTYVGDLIVSLFPPSDNIAAHTEQPILLHNRLGGGKNNLKRTYNLSNAPDLQKMVGQSPEGTWTLQVTDEARYDTGLIRGFSLTVDY